MNKQTFQTLLSERLLSVTPERMSPSEAVRTLDYYTLKIDRGIDDGMDEEEAVAAAGHPDEIFRSILALLPTVPRKITVPNAKRTAYAEKSRKTSPWLVLLLVIFSPVWVSLLFGAAAILFSLYIVLWSLVLSLWAVFVSLIGGGAVMLAAAVPLFFSGRMTEGLAAAGIGFAAVGAALLFLILSLAGTRLAARLTASSFRGFCALFSRKERAS